MLHPRHDTLYKPTVTALDHLSDASADGNLALGAQALTGYTSTDVVAIGMDGVGASPNVSKHSVLIGSKESTTGAFPKATASQGCGLGAVAIGASSLGNATAAGRGSLPRDLRAGGGPSPPAVTVQGWTGGTRDGPAPPAVQGWTRSAKRTVNPTQAPAAANGRTPGSPGHPAFRRDLHRDYRGVSHFW